MITPHTSTAPAARSSASDVGGSGHRRDKSGHDGRARQARSPRRGAPGRGTAGAWPSDTSRSATPTAITATFAASATTAISEMQPGWSTWRCPTGRRGSPPATGGSPSRIASPRVTSASSGPAYSSTIASWIIVSSRWVEGLSTGIRPVSAMTTIRKATKASSRSGLAAQLGCASVARDDLPAGSRFRPGATARASRPAAPARRAPRSSSPGSTPCRRRPCPHRARRARARPSP